MNKDYAVFSLKLANVLASKGFEITKSCANYKNPRYMVYYFKDTPELRDTVDFYISNLNNN